MNFSFLVLPREGSKLLFLAKNKASDNFFAVSLCFEMSFLVFLGALETLFEMGDRVKLKWGWGKKLIGKFLGKSFKVC